jgi:LAO/AO transport system kinase
MSNMSPTQAVLEGNRLALARLLTQVENDSAEGRLALVELFPNTGKAHLIGVTGAPGTGKSSLVNQLAMHYRKNADQRVAIVAVDPSSPFTGGAVLGDRVRMRDLAGDEASSSARWPRAAPWAGSRKRLPPWYRSSMPRATTSS